MTQSTFRIRRRRSPSAVVPWVRRHHRQIGGRSADDWSRLSSVYALTFRPSGHAVSFGGKLLRPAGAALAVVVAGAIGMVPFFAVMACSSDAVRYQGALLGLPTALAAAGLWLLPLADWIGRAGAALARVALLASLAVLPTAAQREPLDPAVLEHRLVTETLPRLPPDTLIVLPGERFANNTVIVEFPDFLLPDASQVVRAGDPRIAAHRGPLFLYLGLACISFTADETGREAAPSTLRPECEALRAGARPWAVRTLTAADLPRDAQGWPWTFHRLALDQPFGFFAPVPQDLNSP